MNTTGRSKAHYLQLVKNAKALWMTIPTGNREMQNVQRRHAFFVACRAHKLSTPDIAKISGFNHATAIHATKMHDSNLMYKNYREDYDRFLTHLTVTGGDETLIPIKEAYLQAKAEVLRLKREIEEREISKELSLKYGL